MLQEAEDNYYITAKYILDLANRAYDLFLSSELDEKRQLIKLVLKNFNLDGKTVRFEAIKPFDTLLSYQGNQLMLRIVNNVRNIIQQKNEYIHIPDLRPYANQ